MEKFVGAVGTGALKGVKTGITLLKIVIPVYLIVVLIKYSPLMPLLNQAFGPAMKIFGLPADGAVPIMTGLFTDEYGVIAAIKSFDFTSANITVIALIALMAHSLPVESVLAQKIGFSAGKLLVLRIVSAILIGIIANFVFKIGGVLL